MHRRRPAPFRRSGLGAVAFLALAAGCGGGIVPVEPPDLSESDAEACGLLVDALPDEVADESRRPVEPAGAPAAAWGEPAIVLRCGVSKPAALTPSSSCFEVNSVGWLFPENPSPEEESTVTTIGRSPYVELQIPASYNPPSTALVDVSSAIQETTTVVSPCV